MKEIFKEKYLEYEPKITLEIFTLVWNKLIELGYKSFARVTIKERYDEFKGRFKYFRATPGHPKEFNCYSDIHDYTKTTVEEILGYNPFIKETTTAKDWNKVTEEELLEEAKRRYPIGCKVKLIGVNVGGDFENEVRFTKYNFNGNHKHLFIDGNLLLFNNNVWAEIESIPEVEVKDETKEAYDEQVSKEPTRLSFYVKYCDEFTKDLLKSLMEWSQKNTTLKDRGRDNSFRGLKEDRYFLFDNFGFNSSKSCLYKDRSTYGYGVDNNTQGCFNEYSIKEVKELIGYKELTKSVEKWSAGSYIVPLQNKLLSRSESLIKGKPYQIIKYTCVPYIICENGTQINFYDNSNTEENEGIKWFATKPEAEEFAKTLVEPTKEEVKQAVHCTTQEEWDFVLSKFNPRKLSSTNFTMDSDSLIITTDESNEFNIGCYGSVRLQQSEYQILSFQEWCKLNNYVMNKKKYTIKELETNRKLIIYIDSKEEHDKIRKVSKRICDYYGNYCYSLYEKTYSSSSSKSCPGAYKDLIILTIDDIIFKDNIENGNKEISNESYIGKYVSFNYNERFYDKAFIIRENSYIYLLNNCHSNNNGHINKSIYKYSLRFDSIEEMLLDLKNIKFLDFKDIEFKPLTEDDLIWEIVEAPDKIKLNYLPEPD